MPRFHYLLAACLVLSQLIGCAQRWHCAQPTEPWQPQLSDVLEPGDRGNLRLAVDSNGRESDAITYAYHALEPYEAQCLAVERSTLGNMLDDQAHKLACQARKHEPCDCVLPHLLHHAALEARNRTAGKVLELYYTIARLEAQKELLDLAIGELDEAVAQVNSARKNMLTLPLKVEEFPQQRLDAERRLIELELGITRANRELAKLLDLEWGDGTTRIWPRTELRVVSDPIAIDEALSVAQAERPELEVVRTLAYSKCVEQLPTMKAVLAGYSAFLAASPLPGSLLFGRLVADRLSEPEELAARQRQFRQLATQREREVRDEVRLAVATIHARHDAAVLAKHAVLHWDGRVDDLRQARDVNKSDWGELVEARLKRIEAQSQLVEAVTAWQIAQVQLDEAQGRLVGECP